MAQEEERELPRRDAVEREREAAGFLAAGFDAAERDDEDFAAVDLEEDFAAVDRDDDAGVPVERAAVERERVAAGFAAADEREVPAGRSRLPTRRASDSTSARSLPSSSSTPCCSSDSRTRVTARATSSTIWVPRSFDPSGSARSTALRTDSMVSAAPEPCLSFFFLSFLGMARV
jgi:hypothetical protein